VGNAASKAGWLIFLVALLGAALRTGPDDPITAGLKSSGLYQPLLVVLCVVLRLLLMWLVRLMKSTVAMRRHLDELENRKGRG
jgi:membrane protein YqaA with SNARE-associated domain